jgi:transposase
VLPGNTADCTTLRDMLRKIEAQYGKVNRVWVMDRGIPTEEVLAEMRAADPPVSYLVGTPKGRLSKLENASNKSDVGFNCLIVTSHSSPVGRPGAWATASTVPEKHLISPVSVLPLTEMEC